MFSRKKKKKKNIEQIKHPKSVSTFAKHLQNLITNTQRYVKKSRISTEIIKLL